MDQRQRLLTLSGSTLAGKDPGVARAAVSKAAKLRCDARQSSSRSHCF